MQTIIKSDIHFQVEASDIHSQQFWPEFVQGDWEPETFQVLEAALKPGRLVLDIGTWIGPVSLYSAAKGCEVISYEPDPKAYDVLKGNIEANPQFADQIRLKKLALAKSTETRKFFAINDFGHSGASLNEFKGATTSIEIECVDAYQELRQYDFDNVCLVKMDIEGAEFEVIPKIAPLLKRYLPPLYLSLHLKDDRNLNNNKINRFFSRLKRYWTLSRALADYPVVYFFVNNQWRLKEDLRPEDGISFLTKHLFYRFNGSVMLAKTKLM